MQVLDQSDRRNNNHPATKRILVIFVLGLLLAVGVWKWWQSRTSLTFNYPGAIRYLAFSPDGKTLATTVVQNSAADKIVIWDTHQWKPKQVLQGNFLGVYFTPDSKSFITEDDVDATASPQALHDIRALKKKHPTLNHAQLVALLNPKYYSVFLQRWDVATGKPVVTVPVPIGHLATLSYNRQYVAYENWSAKAWTFTIWDMNIGKQVRIIPTTGTAFWPEFSPDNHLLATGDLHGDSRKQGLWDLNTGHRLTVLDRRVQGVEAVCFSPDGSLLATATPEAVLLWDTKTWQLIRTLPAEYRVYVNGLRFSRDGKRLVEGSAVRWQSANKDLADFAVTLFDVQRGRQILRAPNEYLEAMSQDGRHFVTTPQLPATGGLRLFDMESGHLFSGYHGEISISPDGHTLLTHEGHLINTGQSDYLTTFHVEKPPQ